MITRLGSRSAQLLFLLLEEMSIGTVVLCGLTRSVLTLAMIGLVLLGGGAHIHAADFYVSPHGDDSHPGTERQPFRTIGRAQQHIRTMNGDMTKDIVVFLRGGVYRLESTLVFDHRDSSTNDHKIVYRNYDEESVIVTGGKAIDGWQADRDDRWKAKVDDSVFRQLYVNGTRAVRARGEKLPDAQVYGQSGIVSTDAGLATWSNPENIELVFDVQWERNICKVAEITAADSGVILHMLEPYFTIARMKEGKQVSVPTHIENALELLDQPGEWYLDRKSGWLYYMPRDGEAMDQIDAVVPVLERLLELRGTLDQPVKGLRFEGITFAHAGWNQPSITGFIDMQANFTMPQEKLILRTGSGGQFGAQAPYLVPIHHEAAKTPANVVLHAARNNRFERCTFTHLGGSGIDLEYGSQSNVISGCTFCDISGTAIQVGDVIDHHPQDKRAIVKNNQVINNYIHHVAVEYLAGVGIFVGYTDGTYIAHNEICHLPYSGISIGWGWGETDEGGGGYWQPNYYDEPTVCKNNVCEHNHIHHVTELLWDGAGIYTLGNMPGSLIRNNHVHDNPGWPGGIYLDEGSGFIEVTGNAVYNMPARSDRAASALFFNNHRQKRNETCEVRDNWLRNTLENGELPPQGICSEAGLEPGYRDLL